MQKLTEKIEKYQNQSSALQEEIDRFVAKEKMRIKAYTESLLNDLTVDQIIQNEIEGKIFYVEIKPRNDILRIQPQDNLSAANKEQVSSSSEEEKVEIENFQRVPLTNVLDGIDLKDIYAGADFKYNFPNKKCDYFTSKQSVNLIAQNQSPGSLLMLKTLVISLNSMFTSDIDPICLRKTTDSIQLTCKFHKCVYINHYTFKERNG